MPRFHDRKCVTRRGQRQLLAATVPIHRFSMTVAPVIVGMIGIPFVHSSNPGVGVDFSLVCLTCHKRNNEVDISIPVTFICK